ncbi:MULTISPECIES: hypothetical protein [Brevibacillus]|uniref:Uncharacterized protein n=1 Tax=Brevibacillus laterosporus TaxID=1465 RepID=A0AAP8QFD5_BRELA|nr:MULTISPECIES: hypothetical protein [Brevibacillus]MBG9790809.1 hypothetical protein [Brevibacillus laterosporus]MCG7318497.1 hypothetical protein [Brevibacillus laterosporus]MCR8981326.1 hypothetical protein [Brevibacillus laterosporus]MCZ0808481.1 hypothetical protein [Brevibacillus laterosporus]MCZ0826802.1 hypothetical protein [Brevibacillus laterosporus]
MKLRKVPMLLSLLAALTLLFGGWFLYQKMQIESPLREKAEQLTSATLVDFKINKDRVDMKLQVTKPDKFVEEYPELLKTLQAYARGKAFDIMLTNQADSLKPVWNEGLFGLTEAIEGKAYSKIPTILAQMKDRYKLDAAYGRIDDANVYIFLKRGNDEYYQIIPRNQSTSEVENRG